jgi:hypothetical protein
MVRSALTLGLLGLSAVSNALPAADKRQVFGIGGGSSQFGSGSNPTTPCLAGVPVNEQPPCIVTSIGTFHPGKRDADKRQVFGIGGGSSQFGSGSNPTTPCLAGVPVNEQPPCIITSTGTFHPGKRDTAEVGAYAAECPHPENLAGAELALERLIQKDKLSAQEYIIADRLRNYLKGCGITIVKSPDGTTTIIKPSDKRDNTSPTFTFTPPTSKPDFDLAGVEKAYEALIQSVGDTKPSFSTWLAIQHLESILKAYGVTIVSSPPGTTTTIKPSDKRQTFTIGKQTCQLSDVLGLKAALAALTAAYGEPAKAPKNVFLYEQVIVSILNLCGQTVDGWTTLTPGNPIPGSPIVPNPTIPGGAITPDPTVPGGAIHPSDKRQAPISDPAALLQALSILESTYGSYGSGKIPVPVFLIMESIVTILQDVPGVVVPGWPILGAGSTTIKPSD